METILAFSFFFFCILILGTISGIFSERAGIVNIAINGFMVFGAIMYAAINVFVQKLFPDFSSSWHQIWLTILAGGLTSLFALLFGFATIKLKSEQTISGFAINVLSIGIVSVLVLILLKVQESGIALSFNIKELALGTETSWKNIISFKFFATVIIIFASWFALRKTRWGLRFRSIGENPQAADVAGINVNKIKWEAVLLAGFIAGFAGALYSQFNIGAFSVNKDVQGLGYIALAIMITAKWRVSLSVVVALFFSVLLSFSFCGISLFGSGFRPYKDLLSILPYLITLIIMLFTSKNSSGPAAAGIPYNKSKR
ncbi:ABC transporter permease [Mycoplasmopsis glycophila]|uniref:Branched-chain amino acid transport system / permease component n=1 Tax=Mycoplasmopsis glycophila TaxID=171285 RepID=A0A449AUK0_9BACT|nr:ABC transporter permease [Mycoplasmopsis glycophila]VEU70150.1 Branched-chain amino acid transport system / permease component [Mycoplasmopsis glycophila]